MEDVLVGYEVAKAAKWFADFQIPCSHAFNEPTREELGNDSEEDNWNRLRKYISRPTQSLLQKWLREVHKKYLIPEHILTGDDKGNVRFQITDSSHLSTYTKWFASYEEALEAGLLKALKSIK